jgi:hypothetical protein
MMELTLRMRPTRGKTLEITLHTAFAAATM